MAVDRTLGAVFGAGRPTGSIFQLTTADLAAGATGTGQHPESPGILEKSFPVPNAFPLDISIVQQCSSTFFTHPLSHLSQQFQVQTRRTCIILDVDDEIEEPVRFKLIGCEHDTE